MKNLTIAALAIAVVGLVLPAQASSLKAPPTGTTPDPASICDAIAGNLVLNCGFETGDFTNWTAGSAGLGSLYGVQSGNENSGIYNAYFGGTTVGQFDSISQGFTDTLGALYTFQFWVANNAGPDNELQAYWDGTRVLDVINSAAFGYTEYSFVETGSGSDSITFDAYQLPGYFFLDDVSVTGVPEPATLALIGTALIGLGVKGFSMRRRRR